MKRILKGAVWGFGGIAVLVAGLWVFGPYEDATLTTSFDETLLEGGVAQHFTARDSLFDDITKGVEKQVIWHGAPEEKTAWSVVYLHGFSATSQEIRPVPDDVAAALGANLVFTRLTGHGRGADAMAEATVQDWMYDVAEALAAARAVGDKVLVLSTSTGGTLLAAAALQPDLIRDVAGVVMIAPNFAVNNPLAPLLTWPAARHWMPLIAGQDRAFEPKNEAQEKFWTTRYPSVAVLPMAALVQEVSALDFSKANVPALFIFSDKDQVVVPAASHDVLAQWGGETQLYQPVLTKADDPSSHVIAGAIASPEQTAPTVAQILTWVQGL